MKKFLIIRFSSIGDIVLTTPVIRCLKKQYPHSEIHFLTKSAYISLLEPNPYLSKIYSIKKNVSEVASDLKRENYDYIIDLHNNVRSAHVKLVLGTQNSVFKKHNFNKWLMVRFKTKTKIEHVVTRYLNTVKKLNVVYDNKGLDYFIPADIVLPELPFAGNAYVALVVGGKFKTKCLPLPKLKIVCMQSKHPLVILGGKDDSEIGSVLSDEFPGKVYNLCGKISLNESARVIESSLGVVANDTGLMHIASALNKNLVLIWGSTVPEIGFYPFYATGSSAKIHQEQVVGLSCRPCSKLGFMECPKGHFDCMNKIDINTIVMHVNSW